MPGAATWQTEEQFEALWNKIDADNSGTIEVEELVDHLVGHM